MCVQARQATVQRSDGGGPTELRANLTSEAFNGVFISSGEDVLILAEGTDSDGISYYNVKYGKKLGWIKQAHVPS